MNFDVIDELNDRGIFGKITANGNYKVPCQYHDDSSPSMLVSMRNDESKGLFYCYGCGVGGHFASLISHIDGIPTYEVKSYLGFNNDLSEDALEKKFEDVIKKVLTSEPKKTYKAISVEKYKTFPTPSGRSLSYLTGPSRKFTEETIEDFDLRVADYGIYRDRVFLPYVDLNGSILSAKARAIGPAKIKAIHVKGTKPQPCLFGLPQLKYNLDASLCVLVEGECDAIYLQQNFIPAVGLGTTRISTDQLKQLVDNFDGCFIALDGDMFTTEEKREKLEKLQRRIQKYIPVGLIRLPETKDPNDLSPEEIEQIFGDIVC